MFSISLRGRCSIIIYLLIYKKWKSTLKKFFSRLNFGEIFIQYFFLFLWTQKWRSAQKIRENVGGDFQNYIMTTFSSGSVCFLKLHKEVKNCPKSLWKCWGLISYFKNPLNYTIPCENFDVVLQLLSAIDYHVVHCFQWFQLKRSLFCPQMLRPLRP